MILPLHEVLHETSLEQTRLALTLFDVLSLVRSERCDFKKVKEAVEENKVFANRILGKANADNYGHDKPIRDIQHAVSLLGFNRVKTILLQTTERSFYHRFLEVEGMLKEVKKHSVAVAVYAQEMAKELRQVYAPEFYKAGLLHDLGKYALIVKSGAEYLKLIEESDARNYSLHLHEKDNLKYDHAELGYQIAIEWNISESIQKVIRYHHEITEEQRESLTTREGWLLDVVVFANTVHKSAGTRTSRSLFRDFSPDLPRPPGDPTTSQLRQIAEAASTTTLELYRQLGLMD